MLKYLDLANILEVLALVAKDSFPPPMVDAAVQALRSGAVDPSDAQDYLEQALGQPIDQDDVLGFLQANLGEILTVLSTPVLKIHHPPQTVNSTAAAELALANGEIVEYSPHKIVLDDGAGNQLILIGSFEMAPIVEPAEAIAALEAPEIIGTIYGFEAKDDGTTMATGYGRKIDLTELMEMDPKEASAMIAAETKVFKGSSQGDVMQFRGTFDDPKVALLDEDGEAEFTVMGLAGDDLITTEKGSQTLMGGEDNDTLFGGYDDDRDILIGGADNDFFMIFQPELRDLAVEAAPEPFEVDFIADFSSEDDTIVFLGELGRPENELLAAPENTGFVGEDQFVQGTMATTEDHRFVYTKATGELFVDRDGSGEDYEQMLVANFAPGTHIEASDIYVGDGFLLQS